MPIKIEEEDQTRTVRPVGGQESTQKEEHKIDFRVPGLPHAVVKEAEKFPSSRARQKDRKSSSSRSTSKPTCSIQQQFEGDREVGNVELFELCETIPKVQCSQCLLLLEPRRLSTALADNSWLKANPEESSTN